MNNCILSTILPAGKLNNASDNSSSHSKQSCAPPTRCAQDITRLPQRLTVSVPTRCATIKVASVSDMNNQDGDQWYTLPVAILNSSSRVPLNCVVALQGDEQSPSHGIMVCFISLSVHIIEGEFEEKSLNNTISSAELTHCIQRKSGYSPNGRATFRICFYHAGTILVSVGIHSVLDEEGLECIGYNVNLCTTLINAVRNTERNAFRSPPLIKFEGPLASKRFQRLMLAYRHLFYRGRCEEASTMVCRIALSDTAALDIKVFMAIEDLFNYSLAVTQLQTLFRKCESLDCQNGSLLQAYAMMALSDMYVLLNDTEQALECIYNSRSVCFVAAPSYLTSWVFLSEARILITKYEGNTNTKIKSRILELFDRAIAHSYSGTGWERIVIFISHIHKALYCLNGVVSLEFNPSSSYIPTVEDISMAEKHLNAVPVSEVSSQNWIRSGYHLALSDLYRLQGDTNNAREHAMVTKQLYCEIGLLCQGIDDRLRYLNSDSIDTILLQYEDQI